MAPFLRLLPLPIIAFWLTMSGLLVRVNVNPEDAAILGVPVEHVLGVMFSHGLSSDLSIMKDREQVGNIALRPREIAAGAPRRLDFSGNLILDLPTVARQTFRWQGSTQMNQALELEEFTLQMDLRKPNIRFRLQAGADRVLHYTIEQAGSEVEKNTVSMNPQALTETLVSSLGVDPAALRTLPGGMNQPTVTAQQNHIHLRHEEIDVYQITVRTGELELATVYVSQLGQILLAKTIFGYSLQAEDISL